MTPKIKIYFIVLFLIVPGYLFSQDIITDRPDKTESVETVPVKKFQIETGIEYSLLKVKGFTIDDSGQELGLMEFKIKSLTAPTTLLRYGIAKNVELRFGFDFDRQTLSANDTVIAESSSGVTLNPPTLGAKVFVAKGKNFIPDFALIGAVKLPDLGAENKQVKHFVPEFVLSFANEINDRFSLGYNLGVEWHDDMGDKEFFYSASLGIEISSRIGAFAEIYGNIPASTDASNQNVDCGVTYLLKNNIQFDIYGGFGLTEDANNFMLGTGISLKF